MGFRLVRVHHEHHDKFGGMLCEIVLLAMAEGSDSRSARFYSAGNTASTPFFFSMTTRNFAGIVALVLRPTVCTSLGPS